ncbi:hypothetical protein F4777DRAFT_285914 [Nemania sp. FL0916]|nr:hypothetical protein F4777DRAFT_285914 [Nemania sp. FL0916]
MSTASSPTPASDLRTEQYSDDDTSTLSSDTSLCCSCPHNPSTVLEQWEFIFVRPTLELTGIKRLLGLNIVSTYQVGKDTYTGVRAIPSYSQEELANTVATAESEWTARRSVFGRFMKQKTYSEDLAKRIFKLPANLPSKVGALLDCRFVATNKNPYIRREWKVVVLKPIAGFMTDGMQGYSQKKFGKQGRQPNSPVQKWVVIIRGSQDSSARNGGLANFTTMSNPWSKVDQQQAADQREAVAVANEHCCKANN